jgi:hypothetical protein
VAFVTVALGRADDDGAFAAALVGNINEDFAGPAVGSCPELQADKKRKRMIPAAEMLAPRIS